MLWVILVAYLFITREAAVYHSYELYESLLPD